MRSYSFKTLRGICVLGRWESSKGFSRSLSILQPVLQHGVTHDVDAAFHTHFIHRV